MAIGRIRKEAVEAMPLPSTGVRAFLWDDRLKGFGVMLMPSGVRSYVVQFRLGGRGNPTKRATIGQHGSPWTAETARKRAVELLEDIRRGVDPVEAARARVDARHEQRLADQRLAFSSYADLFISKHADGRGLRSADDIRAVFRRDLKPWFGDTPVSAIKRTAIRDCLERVGERSGSAANKAHSWLRKMFAWAVDRGDMASSPMDGMSAQHVTAKRKRVLRGKELPYVWQASDDLGHPFGTLVKLLLLTGQRLREVAGMSWEEVDLEAATWIIPGARAKNGHDHLCPLSPQAVDLLSEVVPEPKGRKGFVLSTNGKTPISGFSKAKTRLDGLVADLMAKEV